MQCLLDAILAFTAPGRTLSNYFKSPQSNTSLGLKPRNKSKVSRVPATRGIHQQTEAEVEQKESF